MEAKQKKQMDLLTAIEQIVEKARDSKLSPEFYRKASRYIKYVSDKLDLTKEQSVMLALFMNRSDDNRIRISELSEDVACSTIHILRYMNDIDVLENREFVRCCRDIHGYRKSISYRVPFDVIEAMKRDEKYAPRKCTDLTCQELFGEFEELFDLRNENEITYEALTQKVNSLFEDNKQLQFVKLVNGFFPSHENYDDDKMLVVLFSHLCVNNGDDNIGFHDLDFLFDDKREWNRQKIRISNGDHFLFYEGIIEYNNDNGMVDRESFRVTQKFKDEALSEVVLKETSRDKNSSDYIKSDKIAEKQLFYGQSIQNQIDELGGLLNEGHYQEITSRMKKAGFRCGFTCLFYGAPGTGKTETVLQLARQTGRDILQVDVSKIKSCWVGESEKNIKNVFEKYREAVKAGGVIPILLFNEADAIFGIRREGAEKAVDKMENSIQNIILQELEDLDGILIATTNLTTNLDKAFERRFLYKICFEMPSREARASIWRAMLPSLSIEEAEMLAKDYDFSGGQIENIVRKREIKSIIDTSDPGFNEILDFCSEEIINSNATRRKIGF